MLETDIRVSSNVRRDFVLAVDSGLYWPFALLSGGLLRGYAEAELVFHATRGMTVRVNSFFGDVSFALPLLEVVEERARRLRCRALYVSSGPDTPELSEAAVTAAFDRLDETVMTRFTNFMTIFSQPSAAMIRPMDPGEYCRVRSRLIPLISHGEFVATKDEVAIRMRSGGYRPFVAVRDGSILGYAENNLHHAWLRRTQFMRVERVVVAPEVRGRGIASDLVATLIQDAFCAACTSIELQTHSDNASAIRVYERLGFQKTNGILFAKTIS